MGRLVLLLLWTALASAMAWAVWADAAAEPWERGVALLFPTFGALALWIEWPRLRRRRSLHRDRRDGAEVWVWIDLDGKEAWSAEDPTPEWDAADGDGDGDGGD
ncbi:hypothetical protein JQC91_01570 [Jannaschia sp. Os4]|uniref:hypothetical protein n=1 Tax=Jannaschia sp. Os4 TaxID=2807617 RepID=UPI00193A7652|nr:hypothetical protein [Jannaschia sp. Os4]MBM2574980.1 hypothetical protein [Jannaschia sp. Os4]